MLEKRKWEKRKLTEKWTESEDPQKHWFRAGAGTFWLDAILLIRSHVFRASRSDGSLSLIL